MGRLVKKLVILGCILGALATMSYAGARARAGMILGTDLPDLGPREIRFAFEGATELPDKPLAWIVSYERTTLQGLPAFRIFISPFGKVIATQPTDLERRLEAYRPRLP